MATQRREMVMARRPAQTQMMVPGVGEDTAEELTPIGARATVDNSSNCDGDRDEVQDDDGERRDEQSGPLEDVELCKPVVTVIGRRLGR
jgi:hypothetical protein